MNSGRAVGSRVCQSSSVLWSVFLRFAAGPLSDSSASKSPSPSDSKGFDSSPSDWASGSSVMRASPSESLARKEFSVALVAGVKEEVAVFIELEVDEA
jgi:hypothetical protein